MVATRNEFGLFRCVVLIGTGKLPTAILQVIVDNGDNVIVIEPERNPFSPLKGASIRSEVPYKCIEDDESISKLLREMSNESVLVVSAYNGYIFPNEIVSQKNLTIINFHNSFLPKHRGRNAPTWAIYSDDKTTGITWHEVSEKIDFGRYFFSEDIVINEYMTAGSLTAETLELGASTFLRIYPVIRRFGLVEFQEMDSKHLESPNRSTDIPNDGLLDLSWSFNQVSRFLRSLDYGPFSVFPRAIAKLDGKSLSVDGYSISKVNADIKLASEVSSKRSITIEEFDNRLTINLV